MNDEKFLIPGLSIADMPQGLGMALSRDIDAMRVFAGLSDEQRLEIINGAREIRSRSQMKNYVRSIKK